MKSECVKRSMRAKKIKSRFIPDLSILCAWDNNVFQGSIQFISTSNSLVRIDSPVSWSSSMSHISSEFNLKKINIFSAHRTLIRSSSLHVYIQIITTSSKSHYLFTASTISQSSYLKPRTKILLTTRRDSTYFNSTFLRMALILYELRVTFNGHRWRHFF